MKHDPFIHQLYLAAGYTEFEMYAYWLDKKWNQNNPTTEHTKFIKEIRMNEPDLSWVKTTVAVVAIVAITYLILTVVTLIEVEGLSK